jgi:putative SOS response-associated peptidase YedK
MCNLYSETKGVAAIRAIVKGFERGRELNFPPLPGIFPDGVAPVVTRDPETGERALEMMRWGFPPPPNVPGGRPVTNVRNTASNYWKPSLKTGHRCLVPVTAFCEYQDGSKVPTWFARPAQEGDTRPLFFFAGVSCKWTGTRGTKKDPVEGEHLLYSFLTIEPNAVVAPVHAKAMPVMLIDAAMCDQWLDGTPEEALKLQVPAPEDWLTVVSRGLRKDEG